MPHPRRMTRRDALAVGVKTVVGAAAGALVPPVRPAGATPAAMAAAVLAFTGGASARPGKVKLTLPPLVDNGNAVALHVSVASPMLPEDHVRRIAVFNEKNPQPHVATFHLGPRAGRAEVATRIRLADSQRVVALAELSDGTYWSDGADVVVTLAACLESS